MLLIPQRGVLVNVRTHTQTQVTTPICSTPHQKSRWLSQRIVFVGVPVQDNNTSIHLAAKNGHSKAVHALLEGGASTTSKGEVGGVRSRDEGV